MNYSKSWTDESDTTPIDCSTDQEKTESSSCSSKNKYYKVCSEQIIVHRWFLSDIQSLNNQEHTFYLQSSSFGCTGENGFLHWIIRFHPIAPSASNNKPSIEQKDSLALSKVSKDDENTQKTLLNTLRTMINSENKQSSLPHTESLNYLFNELVLKSISPILKTLPEYSMTTSEEESSLLDDKSYCAFEVLRLNAYQPSSQALFETNYQSNHSYIIFIYSFHLRIAVFEIADDGISSLLKFQGRHQVHFNRALIKLPRHTVFSISSNNILFSIKLIIYECSSTVGSILSNSISMVGLSPGNIFWLMSIEKLFTDIIICSSDGQQFHAHRLILCTSCKKFIELIASNQQIEIDSINGIILERILKYIYTGEIEICIGEFSIDEIRHLLNAADLFELFQLKNILTKKCLNHITQTNCFDLLEIADDKQMNILKNRILTFLCQKFPQVYRLG
jgi:hypothetical protein